MSDNVLIAGKWRLNFNEFITQESMRDAMRTAQTMDAKEILGLLLLYSSATHHVDLTLLKELQRMTDQEQQLTDAVTAQAVTAFDAFTERQSRRRSLPSAPPSSPAPIPSSQPPSANLNTLTAKMKSGDGRRAGHHPAARHHYDPARHHADQLRPDVQHRSDRPDPHDLSVHAGRNPDQHHADPSSIATAFPTASTTTDHRKLTV